MILIDLSGNMLTDGAIGNGNLGIVRALLLRAKSPKTGDLMRSYLRELMACTAPSISARAP